MTRNGSEERSALRDFENRATERPLPDGWTWTTIGKVAKVNYRDPALREMLDEFEVSFVPMAAVDEIDGKITDPQVKSLGETRKGYTPFSEGDVIFAKITPCMENGKAAIARNLRNGLGFGSTEFHVMKPGKNVLAEWLFYYVRQSSFRDEAKANFSGTAGQLRVKKGFIVDSQLPIAPLPEQERIVAEIEKQFTRLDQAVAGLRRLQGGLARYKASVLKAACEGRLVPQDANDEPGDKLLARILAERRAQWQAANPGKKYKEVAGVETAELPDLPDGWVWANIGHLFDVKVGATPSRKKLEYWNGDIPWVSSGEIAFRRISKTRETITTEGLNNSSVKLNPKGTVLLAMIGEGKTRGQAAILDIAATNNQNAAAILCADSSIMPEWVFYWLMAKYEETRQGGSGGMQPALNSVLVRAIPIAVPPLAEQERIVAEVEQRLSVVAATEQAISANLARAERLRQSILHRAFTGQLVPPEN